MKEEKKDSVNGLRSNMATDLLGFVTNWKLGMPASRYGCQLQNKLIFLMAKMRERERERETGGTCWWLVMNRAISSEKKKSNRNRRRGGGDRNSSNSKKKNDSQQRWRTATHLDHVTLISLGAAINEPRIGGACFCILIRPALVSTR